jgi:hypothetical protein
MKRLIALVVVAALASPIAAVGQGLAEVARREEARRKTLKPAKKVYTNADLKPDITQGIDPTPTNATPAEPSTQVPQVNLPGGKAEDLPPAQDEAYWRNRIREARQALERSRIFADALQTRINSLQTDFVNRDDPAQRSQLQLERQRALAELDRVKKEIAAQTKAIADIEEEARKAGVPPGWLR